jgi:hypothetical protein
MESKAMTLFSLHATLKSLFRKEVSIESFQEELYHGCVLYVGSPEEKRQQYMTIEDVLQGKRRVKFSEIQRLWRKNKVLWRSQG